MDEARPLSSNACCHLDEFNSNMVKKTSAAIVPAESILVSGPCHQNISTGVWASVDSITKYSVEARGENSGIGYFVIGSKPLRSQLPNIFLAWAKAFSCLTSPQITRMELFG